MAEMKKAVNAPMFKSTAKNQLDLKTENKYEKIITKEQIFFDSLSFTDRESNDVEKKFKKMPNPNHRSFNPKQSGERLKLSRMLIYEDCSEEEEPVQSTPPNDEDRHMTTPGAPTKSRREFEKKLLRPKKLVYNVKEDDNAGDISEENNNLYYSTPKKSGKKEEDRRYCDKLIDVTKIKPRKILPMRDEESREIYSTGREPNAGSTSLRSVQSDRFYNSRSRGSRKKTFNRGGIDDTRRTSKSNLQKNDMNYNKENNAAQLGAEIDQENTESNFESYKYRSTVKNDRYSILPGNREDFTNSSRIAELTHFRI